MLVLQRRHPVNTMEYLEHLYQEAPKEILENNLTRLLRPYTLTLKNVMQAQCPLLVIHRQSPTSLQTEVGVGTSDQPPEPRPPHKVGGGGGGGKRLLVSPGSRNSMCGSGPQLKFFLQLQQRNKFGS